MAQEFSFDVVSEYDQAELRNALDQTRREVGTRYDFKGTSPTIDERSAMIVLEASTEDRAKAVYQVLVEKAARRGLSAKLFKAADPKTVGKGRGQIEVKLNAGIDEDLARDLRKRAQGVSKSARSTRPRRPSTSANDVDPSSSACRSWASPALPGTIAVGEGPASSTPHSSNVSLTAAQTRARACSGAVPSHAAKSAGVGPAQPISGSVSQSSTDPPGNT